MGRITFLHGKKSLPEDAERQEILEAMRQTREELHWARACFNDAKEPELVEACVFEMNALQARYSYLLRLAKEMQFEQDLTFRSSRAAE